MANFCLNEGYLVGVAGVVPDDETIYTWPTSIVGCTKLHCGMCKQDVRSTPGYEWSVNQKPDLKTLLAATSFDGIDGLDASTTGRVYRCGCTVHIANDESSIAQYRDTQRSSVGAKWACAGHLPVTLPATIAGVAVAPQGNAREWVLATTNDPDFSTGLDRLLALYFRLRGTSVESHVTMAIAALVNDDDALRRDFALAFYAQAPFVPGGERVGIWAVEHPELFKGTSAFQNRDRWKLTMIVAGKTVMAGRPYEPPVQTLLRREALTEANAFTLYNVLSEHDRDWFVAHAHEFPASVSAKIEEAMKYRATSEEQAAYHTARAAKDKAAKPS